MFCAPKSVSLVRALRTDDVVAKAIPDARVGGGTMPPRRAAVDQIPDYDRALHMAVVSHAESYPGHKNPRACPDRVDFR
ncbi:MAG: hypothetical protein QOJ56_6253 [Mycobacterium sp.]|jgi:hypothetical protein|nr:hypothetical protein [Mycobacterium sp.]